jgi:DNA-binding GntR family transcriptional regulator
VPDPDPVADRLRNDILRGEFAPNERLVELTLSEAYGVGRSAIRSALVELAKEGLIEREANRGATVRRIPIAEAVQLNEARRALECLIARAAADQATDAQRTRLADIGRQMRTAVENEDYLTYSNLNKVLHQRLSEASGHTVAAELVANLKARSARHQFRLALQPGRPDQSLPEHEAIIAAVVAGDGDEADQAMYQHLSSVIEALRHWANLGVEV